MKEYDGFIILGILFLFAVALAIFLPRIKEKYLEGKNFFITTSIFLFLGISIELTYVILRINYERNRVYEKVIYEILSLKNSSSIDGHFALGYGSVETKSYYFFYVEDEKGYKLEKIESEKTYIKPLEDSIYNVPTIMEKKIKGKTYPYYIIYLPQEYIVFDYNI